MDERVVRMLALHSRLPKTNCKKCGLPTCLALALLSSTGKTELYKCPYYKGDDEYDAFLLKGEGVLTIKKGESSGTTLR